MKLEYLKTAMKKSLYKRSLISIEDLSEKDIRTIISHAGDLKETPRSDLLKGRILASCFFEPSTRTRLSFESAMLRLGGSVIGFSSDQSTSAQKGESLSDTMKIIGNCADVIALRHPKEGASLLAAESTKTPIINAGDGANQHPTQTLLDLFTIQESQGTLEDLQIAIVGDLKYGRTAHSLALALSCFRTRLYFVSPDSLMMPPAICHKLKRKQIKFSFHKNIDDLLHKCDILYMTRIQKERFPSVKNDPAPYRLKPEHLKGVKKMMRILHPLPRVDEINPLVDHSPHALYFEQAHNGIFVRQAILSLMLR